MEQVKNHGASFIAHREVKKNDAVMFDIDDTLIFHYRRRPNEPVIELARIAHILGYEVIIITARPNTPKNTQYTIDELNRHNIPYDSLVFADHMDKDQAKRDLKMNFILSVGDLWSDLGVSRHWIKLPSKDYPYFKISSASHI